MMKIPKQEYTTEFKELAVKHIEEGLTAGAVSKELGVSDQTLRNWVKAAARQASSTVWSQGSHTGTDGAIPVTHRDRPIQQAGE